MRSRRGSIRQLSVIISLPMWPQQHTGDKATFIFPTVRSRALGGSKPGEEHPQIPWVNGLPSALRQTGSFEAGIIDAPFRPHRTNRGFQAPMAFAPGTHFAEAGLAYFG